ncbi:phosphonate metabolism protein/1,5-bisphosphokinase (PRPP-forming) PhnN [Pseudomonas sp. CFBP 8771]|uniref:phosphonate metabolism protein/1,5-bisphosphokinase (PRPP-forming) PhnN n=1 Tax=Pseudomonas sp. CFBP 8771 TaxID=2775285 RepID=UPI00177D083B|nr:phosphonate metabolism protein/1,5-bisphosphokinase (PRPP-forming) PhnN [Pseudomonas sp. CFBP 8771]MBD8602868.1 phosphonate metabolism protein/1,5-bisphosphokinase (PRPP-forming) PhnN [Pseudomonas sp. CFBP 8771]
MAQGIFFFVVGPSGAGKDSLIEGARARLGGSGRYLFARRTITRPSGAPGEDHTGVTAEQFQASVAAGEFLLSWHAHGLSYGLSADLLQVLEAGDHVIANGSRRMIREAAARVPHLVVIEVTAAPEVLAARILGRGRETAEQASARVLRQVDTLPADIETLRVDNDGTLAAGIEGFIDAVQSVARRHAGLPTSHPLLARKVQGHALDETQYESLLRDIIEGRYTDSEIGAFLVSASQHLSDAEVMALARVRTRFSPIMRWDRPMVVDKHSMGGVPGSRITLIVVPIVAAHGLAMPKTSSRAITSAAGTADAMEVLAEVELTPAQVRQCVAHTGACIAWNGRLNHSHLDEVMNTITRPLRIDSTRWAVASILSKKLTAGSTHVIVDLPFGPRTKLASREQAQALGELFEQVGALLGLTVVALVTDGSRPVGRGIGPALEVRDVRWVLEGAVQAPADLREKALVFAAQILAWDPQVGSVAAGRRRAEQLLDEGCALAAFERMIDAQGRRVPVMPSALTCAVRAPCEGHVARFDGWRLAEIARCAGAPRHKGAGIDLKVDKGTQVAPGDVLYVIHGASTDRLECAARLAHACSGIELATPR